MSFLLLLGGLAAIGLASEKMNSDRCEYCGATPASPGYHHSISCPRHPLKTSVTLPLNGTTYRIVRFPWEDGKVEIMDPPKKYRCRCRFCKKEFDSWYPDSNWCGCIQGFYFFSKK